MLFILFFCYVGLIGATSPLPPAKPCPSNNGHKKCGKNEHPVKNMKSCQKTCGNRLLTYPEGPCPPYSGCVCKNGFVRPHDNATGTCIRVEQCPPIPKNCGCNEIPTSCAQVCPPQSCNISYTDYLCLPQECKPGCNCKPDYLRNSENICILNNDCPPPPGTPVDPIEPTPADDCCDDRCRPTCAVPNPPNCPPPPCYDPKDPCQCPPEYILSEKGGKCIYIDSCPDNNTCNGKKNAIIKSCAMQCPATCDKPNSRVKDCKKECKLGCECKPGYILSKKNGECIPPEKCPCGYPCKGPNEVYTSCTVSCTPVYCPKDDVNRVTVCDIPSPCDSGCVCKHNHRRLSVHNDTCIPAECCPPIKCTRKNEKYFGCRPYCPIERCSEVGKPCSPPIVRECDPRCTCKDGYYRNNKDVCVKESECHPIVCGPNEEVTDQKTSCPPETCESIGRLYKCPAEEPKRGCKCIDGYYRDSNNKCIPKDQCPKSPYVPPKCGPNEYFEVCSFKCPPQTCPSKSDDPCDPGDGCCRNECRCIDGYLRDSNGNCIPADQCCQNLELRSTSQSSSSSSSSSYSQASSSSSSSSQSSSQVSSGCGACPLKCKSTCSNPNPTGCDPNPNCNCKSGYVWTKDGRKCIPISQCPTDCSCNGDPNAHIMERPPPCPSTCDNPDGMPSCKKQGLAVGCACNTGFLLNENGICVTPEKCPGACPLKCKSTCSNPNPIGCDPNPNCHCKSGYVWTKDGRKCIPISQCPTDCSCNGDPNAHIMESPPACPSTCDTPDGIPLCKRRQLAVGCACNIGFLFNENGMCVTPEKCPGGDPCGVNGTFAPCKMDCLSSFCPKDDRLGQVICDPAPNCPPGCVCKYKYRWRSEEDRTCILAQECPERKCTRPCERWNSCPSPCLDESCSSFNNPPSTCNTLIEPACYPQCTCKDGHARNDEGICIPGEDCPK